MQARELDPRAPGTHGMPGADFAGISAILAATNAEATINAGIEVIITALGPGYAALGFAADQDEYVPLEAFGWNPAIGVPIRLSAGDGVLKAPLQPACLDLQATPARVKSTLTQLPSTSRAALTAVLGQATPAELLCVNLASRERSFGYMVLASRESGLLRDNPDIPVVQLIADLTTLVVEHIGMRRSIEEATRLKTEVISALSHQMRTPLASIRGYSTALLLQGEEYDEPTRRDFLQIIDDEAGRLSSLVGDLLESSAIEAGLLHIEYQPVMLPRLARDVMKVVAQRNGSHKFVASFPPRFPVMHADPDRIKQVLHNLLDNAVKYSPDGGLVFVRGVIQGDEAVVSVADQGVGIAPEHLNRLFERFFRIKGNLRRPVSGSGLGLPIARAIVEAHGGRIWAESVLGGGTTFYFTLPLRRLHEDEEQE